MSDPKAPPNLNASPLEVILYMCDKARPEPWYPSSFSRDHGIPRDVLDPHLDRLRLAGLIRLTDWVAGSGQGYTLTPSGEQVFASPRTLAGLRQGKVPQADAATAVPGRTAGTTAWERGEQVRDAALQPPGPGVVTRVLVLLNVVVFLVGLLLAGNNAQNYLTGGDRRVFAQLGGLSGEDLLRGRWWELLTCCFVHAGLLHIGFNMYALSALGPRAEQLWGRWRFLALYLVAGLVGSCAAVHSPLLDVWVVGASGAVYGLLGAELGFLVLNRRHLPPAYVAAWGKNLAINGFLMLMVNMIPGISGAAHWGGGIGGAVCAVLLTYQRFGTPTQRRLSLVGVALTPVVAVAWLVHTMDTQPDWIKYTEIVETRACLKQVEPVGLATKEFLKVYDDTDNDASFMRLFRTPESEWDPADVEKALQRLRAHREQLTSVADRLAAAGPYRSPAPVKFLAASRELLHNGAKLAEAAEEYLQAKEGWPEMKKALRAQRKQVGKDFQTWEQISGWREDAGE